MEIEAYMSSKTKLESMLSWSRNWDGNGADPPQRSSVERAMCLLGLMDCIADPHITANSEGLVVLEWWKGEGKLTIYVSEDEIDVYLTDDSN